MFHKQPLRESITGAEIYSAWRSSASSEPEGIITRLARLRTNSASGILMDLGAT
jgi:hypothetical protein